MILIVTEMPTRSTHRIVFVPLQKMSQKIPQEKSQKTHVNTVGCSYLIHQKMQARRYRQHLPLPTPLSKTRSIETKHYSHHDSTAPPLPLSFETPLPVTNAYSCRQRFPHNTASPHIVTLLSLLDCSPLYQKNNTQHKLHRVRPNSSSPNALTLVICMHHKRYSITL